MPMLDDIMLVAVAINMNAVALAIVHNATIWPAQRYRCGEIIIVAIAKSVFITAEIELLTAGGVGQHAQNLSCRTC